MASIYESVVSILKQPVTPKGTTVRDTLVESNGLARPTKGVEDIDEAARYHAGQHVTGKYRSGIGHYTIDRVVKGTEDSSDPEYVVTQHDNHVSASGKKEPKQLKHRQSDLHATNEDRLDELSPELKRRYAKAAAADLADTAEKHAASSYVSSDFDDIIDNRLRGLKRLGAGKEARRLEKASYYVGSTDDGYDAQDRARKKLLRKFDESVLESVEFNALIESTAEVLSEAASRNDYVAVAKILHDAGSAGDDQFESPAHAAGYRRAIKHLGAELADHFKRTNSAFSHDRFRKAAGLDDVER